MRDGHLGEAPQPILSNGLQNSLVDLERDAEEEEELLRREAPAGQDSCC